ncbi:MAG: hypothetical protein QXS41_02240 [Candidatus Woesearchaeota archaeon]
MKISKRGAELTINIIIGVAIAVIALIILLIIFSSNSGKQSKEYNQYIEGRKKIQTYINMLPEEFREIQTKASKITSMKDSFSSAMEEIKYQIPNNKLMNLIQKEGYDLCIIGENKNFFTQTYDSSYPHHLICLFSENFKRLNEDEFKKEKELIQQTGIYLGKTADLQSIGGGSGGTSQGDVYLCKCS